ncbi:MAG: hypothetical protein WBX11_17750 [Thiobacillaceae bacterium]
MSRTMPRTLPAQCEQTPRTLGIADAQNGSLKALAGAVLTNTPGCANVRTYSPAQSHITQDRRTLPRTLSAQCLTDELTRLVRLCGDLYRFTEAEHREALALALAHPEDAWLSYSAMAKESQPKFTDGEQHGD